MTIKPRVIFCWECSGKLEGNHHIEKPVPRWSGDDVPRILHKSCSKKYDEGIDFQYDVETHFKDDMQEPDEFESYGEVFV